MAYIGTPSVDRFTASKAASVYSGDGSATAFTLEHSVGSDEDILVSVDGVIQEPSVAYAVSSGTTLTFTAAPSSNAGNNIFVYYLFSTLGTVTHPATSALSATSGTFSTTLASTGNATVGGTLGVTGATTLTGALSAKGGAVFNEDSADVDFRVESNGNANMIFVDGGNDAVGIGNNNPNDFGALVKDLVIGTTSGEHGMTIVTGTANSARIQFSDNTASPFVGAIEYAHGSTNSLIFYTDGSSRMTLDSSGNITVPQAYQNTTGGSANCFIAGDGTFKRSTSSLKYKNTVNDATHGLTELLTLRPVTYKGNNDGDIVFGGLIAEEVHDAGLTEFVEYNDDDKPDALAYGNMVSLCIKAIQELKTELDEAKARITALENA